ncbi:MAG TPA: bifunctional proline dehydrogenase/L-glutamate gamma-semialdehyde dehydrogenase, partial [Actinomycetota bacterium]|nr:bifunctional proline dehydrogenase/L-glutamate gamma-semialdehyde dehydrogenase [Actinomycetota bacterium]
LDLADRVPFGRATSALVARRNIRRMARQFIVGESPEEAEDALRRLWGDGSAFTVDLLGEKTLTDGQADAYAARVLEMLESLAASTVRWDARPALERDDQGPLARVNLSVKPTALSPLFAPLTADEGVADVKSRLRPILRRAQAVGAFLNLDTEQYDVKSLTYRLAKELWGEPEFEGMEGGVVVQAYLKESADDLADLIEWSGRRARPFTVRLVKGAYWDAETVVAQTEGWPVPVFEHKAQTDLNYERCIRLLHHKHGKVRAAFASHNLRSLAYAVAYGRELGIPDRGYELQMLYGMAEPIQHAIRSLGLRLRVYAPVGQLIPGMAYLVRRLLENTSNESFIRHRFAEGRSLEELVAVPEPVELAEAETAALRPSTDAANPAAYSPEPLAEWRQAPVRDRFGAEVAGAASALGLEVPAVIGGREVRTAESIVSVDPGNNAIVVARSAACGPAEAEEAVAVAAAAWDGWRRTPARERAGVLFRAGDWMRRRRGELAALEVFEAGKPWREADADVCEAIDFCEYYGREMIRLDRGGLVESPPGERNRLTYDSRGVGVVIAPWNFPLAIPMGMTSAALVAGNPVILKPAEQTPAVAWQIVRAFRAAGLPDGVLSFLPGYGEQVGPALVEHPDVSFIAFTGSRAVGLGIVEGAARAREGQTHVKRVIAEMGGKNAIIVDSDADLDQAVPGILYSAFGYAGQKCSAASRLIVLSSVYEQTLERLAEAAHTLLIGHPRHPGTTVGPVIDADAYDRIRSYVAKGQAEGRAVLLRDDVPDGGWYVGPAIFDALKPDSDLVRHEIFGPVLAVLRAGSFDEALALANDTEYALTGGLFSRLPSHLRRAAEELRAGNVYLNRPITGAIVGRQPFGGYGMSGVGSKAGGPDYLMQFLNPRTVTENMLRQGFAPSQEAGGV